MICSKLTLLDFENARSMKPVSRSGNSPQDKAADAAESNEGCNFGEIGLCYAKPIKVFFYAEKYYIRQRSRCELEGEAIMIFEK